MPCPEAAAAHCSLLAARRCCRVCWILVRTMPSPSTSWQPTITQDPTECTSCCKPPMALPTCEHHHVSCQAADQRLSRVPYPGILTVTACSTGSRLTRCTAGGSTSGHHGPTHYCVTASLLPVGNRNMVVLLHAGTCLRQWCHQGRTVPPSTTLWGQRRLKQRWAAACWHCQVACPRRQPGAFPLFDRFDSISPVQFTCGL